MAITYVEPKNYFSKEAIKKGEEAMKKKKAQAKKTVAKKPAGKK